MSEKVYKYEPNYTVPPGWYIEEILETRGWKQSDLARHCDLTPKTISGIISGKAPISPRTAIQLSRVLNVSAELLANMDTNYQLQKEQLAERKKLLKTKEWLRNFPTRELVKRGYFEKPENDEDTIEKLLTFFGFGSIESWETRFKNLTVHCRQSRSFQSHFEDVMAWLRIGQIIATQKDLSAFNETSFRKNLKEIRKLTLKHPRDFQRRMVELCSESGVVFCLVKPIGKNRLCGATHWVSPYKPIIQMTIRNKTNDHFWFTFFHEAAHILYHKKETYISFEDGINNEIEKEANRYASDILIPRKQWKAFINQNRFKYKDVLLFANEIGIAPGIVVGRLQYEKIINYNQFNKLKVTFEWAV